MALPFFDVNASTWSELRDAAHEASQNGAWRDAAIFMQQAIDRYPQNGHPIISRNDVAQMRNRMVLYIDLADDIEDSKK